MSIVIEITTAGYYYPSQLKASVIRLFHEDDDTSKTMMILEIVRFVLSFYFLYITIRTVLNKDEEGNRNWTYVATVKGAVDLLIFSLIASAFTFYFLHDIKKVDILKDEYTDLLIYSDYYTNYLVCNAWLILILLFRSIVFLNFSNRVNTFMLTIELAAKNIICFLCILAPLLLGLVVITYHIYGPFNYHWRSFSWALLSNIMFVLGYSEIEDLIEISEQ